MKVCYVPFCYYPGPVGGTEVYVASMAKELRQQAVEVVIAAPGERTSTYTHNDLSVHRFAVTPTVETSELYGAGDTEAARIFGRILDTERPDIVHLHAFTRGASVLAVREAKQRSIPVVFTYHTPTVSCQRGTLMQWGTDVCDGELNIDLCTRCTLQGLGLPRPLASAITRVPAAGVKTVVAVHPPRRLATALQMRDLLSFRHASFHALMAEVDHVVAVCQWVKDLLVRNSVPLEKISISRQGLLQPAKNLTSRPENRNCPDSALQIAFLGRLHPDKGADILIRAFRLIRFANVSLDIYGVMQSKSYQDELLALAKGDTRIRFLPPVDNSHVIETLTHYDLLAVPSRWMETGPLVVLEAFAAGIPVIGSRLGGIAELVDDGVDGLLVEPDSPESWAGCLRQVVEHSEILRQLCAQIKIPRSMTTVADEMLTIYHRLLN